MKYINDFIEYLKVIKKYSEHTLINYRSKYIYTIKEWNIK